MPRVKVEYRTSSRSVYDTFCIKNPDIKLTFEQWSLIIYTYNHLFRDYILETGDRVKLPWGLGSFTVSKKKSKKFKVYEGKEWVNLPVDWQKSRKEGKYIYNFNSHTDGYRFRWLWGNRDARFAHADIWSFKPSRTASRKIAEYLHKPGQAEFYKQWERR